MLYIPACDDNDAQQANVLLSRRVEELEDSNSTLHVRTFACFTYQANKSPGKTLGSYGKASRIASDAGHDANGMQRTRAQC